MLFYLYYNFMKVQQEKVEKFAIKFKLASGNTEIIFSVNFKK